MGGGAVGGAGIALGERAAGAADGPTTHFNGEGAHAGLDADITGGIQAKAAIEAIVGALTGEDRQVQGGTLSQHTHELAVVVLAAPVRPQPQVVGGVVGVFLVGTGEVAAQAAIIGAHGLCAGAVGNTDAPVAQVTVDGDGGANSRAGGEGENGGKDGTAIQLGVIHDTPLQLGGG